MSDNLLNWRKVQAKIKKLRESWDWWLASGLIFGLVVRILELELRPAHPDEGVNGYHTDQLLNLGYYPYDPQNYHGPFLFYVLALLKLIFGRELWALRAPSVVFGFFTLVLAWSFRKKLGILATRIFVWGLAISPGLVYFSRDGIHEITFLFFSMLAAVGVFQSRVVLIIWGIVGMFLNKETVIIHVGTALIAWFCLKVLERFSPSTSVSNGAEKKESFGKIAAHGILAVAVVLAFYSGFGKYQGGLKKMLEAYFFWSSTGTHGHGHEKPFFYWLGLLARYEWMALLGLSGSISVLWIRHRLFRWLGIYGIGIFLAYSIIPYKTPWCLIQIVWPSVLVFSYLVQNLWKKAPWIVGLCFVGISLVTLSISYRLNFLDYDRDSEPYVYAQTYRDLGKAMNRIMGDNGIERRSSLQVQVIADELWPIPWYLADYKKLRYWMKDLPPDPNGDVIITDADRRGVIEPKLKKKYYRTQLPVRQWRKEMMIYWDAEKFNEDPAMGDVLVEASAPRAVKYSAELFSQPDGNGKKVADVEIVEIPFQWDDKTRPYPVPLSLKIVGKIKIPEAGLWKIRLTSDDGSILKISGKTALDHSGVHAMITKEGSQMLEKKIYPWEILYSDIGGGGGLSVEFISPSGKTFQLSELN